MKAIKTQNSFITHLPILISFSIAALWVWHFHAISQSTALFLGVIAGGLVDLDNRLTGRIRNISFTLMHFTCASVIVQLTLSSPWFFSLIMVLAAFSVTVVGVIDIRYRTIAFGTLLVMIYTALTYVPTMAWYINPIMLICGTLLYSFCTIILHLVFPHRPVQEKITASFDKLAQYMIIKAQFFDPDETDFLDKKEIKLAMVNTGVINSFNECRSALFYRLRSQYRHPRTALLLQYYFIAQNIHEKISSQHVEYQAFSKKMAHSDLIFRIQRLIVLQAEACQGMAKALRNDETYEFDESLTRAGNGLKQAFSLYDEKHHSDEDILFLKQLIDNILAISFQLSKIPNLPKNIELNNPENNIIAGQDVDKIREILPALKSHFTFESSVFRHAVRMGIIAAASCFIIAVSDLKMGYWILLTALLVCQPNYSATKSRLQQRIVGTLLGVLIGSLLPYFVPDLEGRLLIVVISSTLFFVFRKGRYSFSTFFITVQVLVSFSIIGMDTDVAMLSRFIDTIIGALIAWLAVSYLWPDWHYLTLKKTISRALNGDAGYLQQVLLQLQTQHVDDVEYRIARRIAHERSSALSNVVSDMTIESKKYGTQLTTALSLLQINYALLSSISALGAYRDQMEQNQDESSSQSSLTPFFIMGDELADLMRLPVLDSTTSKKCEWTLQQLNESLDKLKPSHEDLNTAKHILWGQLNRILEKLNGYYLIAPSIK